MIGEIEHAAFASGAVDAGTDKGIKVETINGMCCGGGRVYVCPYVCMCM